MYFSYRVMCTVTRRSCCDRYPDTGAALAEEIGISVACPACLTGHMLTNDWWKQPHVLSVLSFSLPLPGAVNGTLLSHMYSWWQVYCTLL